MATTPQKPSSPRSASLTAFAPSTDDDTQFLPWKIAFRVLFRNEKLGLRFHPAQYPDTGNGVYTVRLLELIEGPDGSGPAQQHNASLRPDQEHLALRPGLYLTHINDEHLLDVACEVVIKSLQTVSRPVSLRFVDAEAGVVTPHELQIELDPKKRRTTSGAASPRSNSPRKGRLTSAGESNRSPGVGTPIYKIILLGTTGVGKSSLLAVGVNGDSSYQERRATTLEAEFGTIEVPDPDFSNPTKIKARIWDTAGQERYRAITRSHYRRADGALLVYDVADPESFDKLGEWLKTLRETAGDSLKSIMVVENKIDQLPEWQAGASGAAGGPRRPESFVQEAKVQAFCKENGLLFTRTSAKMNASAFKWEGQRVADVVSHLILNIHATALARGMNQAHMADSVSGESTTSANVVLKDPGQSKRNSSPFASECGNCGK